LRGAFGLSDDGTGNRFLLSIAVLSLLSEASEKEPLLCVVDDAHWLDRPSADALRFCSRRVGAEGVAVLIAAGSDGPRTFDAPDLPELDRDVVFTVSGRTIGASARSERLARMAMPERWRRPDAIVQGQVARSQGGTH
jgi:hypothetical protein